MKKLTKLIKTDKIIKWGTIGSLVLIVITLLCILFFYFSLPPYIPLFNQLPWSNDRLGSRAEIFLPLSLAIIFFICNLFSLVRLYDKLPLLSRMLGFTSFLIVLLMFIFTVRTLLLIS